MSRGISSGDRWVRANKGGAWQSVRMGVHSPICIKNGEDVTNKQEVNENKRKTIRRGTSQEEVARVTVISISIKKKLKAFAARFK